MERVVVVRRPCLRAAEKRGWKKEAALDNATRLLPEHPSISTHRQNLSRVLVIHLSD
jgi:hypothetical protein